MSYFNSDGAFATANTAGTVIVGENLNLSANGIISGIPSITSIAVLGDGSFTASNIASGVTFAPAGRMALNITGNVISITDNAKAPKTHRTKHKNGSFDPDIVCTIPEDTIIFSEGSGINLASNALTNTIIISADSPITNTYDSGSSATWTKPANAKWAKIQLWGGGGSGAKGASNIPGGGGGGGSYNEITVRFTDLVGNVIYTVGAGGVGKTAAAAGNDGGTTSVTLESYKGNTSITLSAFGGGGGGYNATGGGGGGGGGILSIGTNATTSTSGAAGGSPMGGATVAASTNGVDSTYGGGSGSGGSNATGYHGGSSYYGGGGGGSGLDTGGTGANYGGGSYYGGGGGGGAADSGTVGTNGGTSVFGGNGSDGAKDANNSLDATTPAGGSGGTEGGNSGAGGSGRIQFTYW